VNVKIVTLANNEVSRMSFSGVDDVVQNGADTTITINVRGADKTVDVPSGTTLSGLATLINKAGIGVTANVYDSGDGTATPARLTLTDNTLGDYSTIQDNITYTAFSSQLDNVSSDPTVATTAVNTDVQINGEDIYTSSHTIADVIPGVTLNLLSANNDSQTLTVSESTGDASQKISDLVDQYNKTVALIRQAIHYDPTQTTQTNPTAGDATLRNVLTSLENSITSLVPTLPNGTSVHSLTDLGVTTVFNGDDPTQNGTLSFDSSKFNTALSENYDDVINFFQGITQDSTTYKGWADQITDVMNSFLDSTNGSISSKISSLDKQVGDLEKKIQDKLAEIDQKHTDLKNKFARLEAKLSDLNGQQSTLTSMLSSLSLNNQAISRGK